MAAIKPACLVGDFGGLCSMSGNKLHRSGESIKDGANYPRARKHPGQGIPPRFSSGRPLHANVLINYAPELDAGRPVVRVGLKGKQIS